MPARPATHAPCCCLLLTRAPCRGCLLPPLQLCTFFFTPETRGKSLEELGEHLESEQQREALPPKALAVKDVEGAAVQQAAA
jgi:hypothetical protein